jgi:hypothetical protein
MLVGRTRERARLERLLEEARAGRSTALLLHGDPATPGDRFTAPAGLLSLLAAAAEDQGAGARRRRAMARQPVAGGAPLLEGDPLALVEQWARATLARSRARLAPDDQMRARFDDTLALPAQLPTFERARTLLVLGERLRRAKQRAEARAAPGA